MNSFRTLFKFHENGKTICEIKGMLGNTLLNKNLQLGKK